MNHSSRAPWPTSNIENDQIRLQNVFRVLCKPEHALWEEALELRLEISARWSSYAAQNQWFPWPDDERTPKRSKIERHRVEAVWDAQFLRISRGRN
jgi:hypothetical protein